MMRGDGRGDMLRCALHELHRIAGGDVFEHHAQLRQIAQQRDHDPFDEHRLAVEHIHAAIGHLTMHQQRHPAALHLFQRRICPAYVGHARIGVGGRPRRIQLDRMYHAALSGAPDLLGRGVVGEIQGHQRLECRPCRQGSQNALAVGLRLCGGGDRRPEIGHHDGTGELPRGVLHD